MATEFYALGRLAVPAGGTTGQVLAKRSDANFETQWTTASGITGGGLTDEQVADLIAEQTQQFVTSAQVTNLLAGYATAAALSQSETFARDRANHNGLQDQTTIIGLVRDLADKADLINGKVPVGQLPDMPSAGVSTVNGKAGPAVTLTKADMGLGNVNDTSDVNKPVSTAQAAALAQKSQIGHSHAANTLTGMGATFAALIPAATTTEARNTLGVPAVADLATKATIVFYDHGAPAPDPAGYPAGNTVFVELDA